MPAQPQAAGDHLDQLRAQIRETPLQASVWKSYGLGLARARSYELSADAFTTSCRLDPNHLDACYFAGRLSLLLHRYEAASTSLDQALKRDSSTSRPATAHRLAGLSAVGLHQAEQAEKHFKRAVNLWRRKSENSGDPRIDYADFLYKSGRLATAEEMLIEAIEAEADSPTALALLGRVRIHLGAQEAALQPLRQAVALSPCEWDYRLLLGKALLATGDTEEGTKQMRLGREGWIATAPEPGPVDNNASAFPVAEPCHWAK